MGYRVRIVARRESKEVHEDGMRGLLVKTLYSAKQMDCFNNDSSDLADWLNEYTDEGYINSSMDEWVITLSALESIPDKAFQNPIAGRTEEEMRRFIAECIRCAKLTEGECHLEWW